MQGLRSSTHSRACSIHVKVLVFTLQRETMESNVQGMGPGVAIV